MSRLRIWMTPVPDDRSSELGDFTVWNGDDDTSDSMVSSNGNLLNHSLENQQHQQHQYGTNHFLNEKKGFCCKIESSECLRCIKRSSRESSCNSSNGSTSGGSDVFGIMTMKIGYWKPLPQKTCGFCYIQYKRHCQKLGIPFPRATDPGFWVGHTTKDDNGDVVCPELRKLMCPLCFATGNIAHTLKFCPLNQT